jgi:hypothetical protein
MTGSEQIDYATTIWAAVRERIGKPQHFMSSAEWAQVVKWRDEGIPLRVVLRGIADCGGQPRTLLGVAPAVEEAYRRWRKSLVS